LVRHPPGSSEQEIAEEPDWGAGHEHRIGYRNRQNRYAGITHHGDHPYAPFWTREDRRYAEEVLRKQRESKERAEKGDLLNFQQIARVQTVSMNLLKYWRR
jgi:nitrate reductase (NAD(P)H)